MKRFDLAIREIVIDQNCQIYWINKLNMISDQGKKALKFLKWSYEINHQRKFKLLELVPKRLHSRFYCEYRRPYRRNRYYELQHSSRSFQVSVEANFQPTVPELWDKYSTPDSSEYYVIDLQQRIEANLLILNPRLLKKKLYKCKNTKISDLDEINGDLCVICYDTYKVQDQLVTLPCKHKYHLNCIFKWLKRSLTCPVCREPF